MKAIGVILGRFWAVARARAAIAVGRLRLLRGDVPRAARAFEAAVGADPRCFEGWLHLARARLRERDLFRARRALARAREESPAGFERDAALWVRREGFDLGALTDGGARPEPASRHPAYLAAGGGGGRSLPFGDCRDLDEYARFGAMPPIAPSEWEDLDLDELAEDLQDG
jgi:hypothetical protein